MNKKREIFLLVFLIILFWKGKDYVWTSTGDTLFLRDDEGKLVLWEMYNRE